jgi:hypothetical protein
MKTCPKGAVDDGVAEGGALVAAQPVQTSVRADIRYNQRRHPVCKPKSNLVVCGADGLESLPNM